jgi:hypothetical protein
MRVARRDRFENGLMEGELGLAADVDKGHRHQVRVPVERDHGFRWKMISHSGGT